MIHKDVQLFRGSWTNLKHIKTSSLIKFKGNSKLLLLGRNNYMYYGRNIVPHVSPTGGLDNGSSEKALRVHKVNIRQKYAFVKRKPTTSSFTGNITSGLKGIILSLPFGTMGPVVCSHKRQIYWSNSTKKP